MKTVSGITLAAAIVASSVAQTGCASLVADPCSAKGVELRLGQELAVFSRQNRADIREIRDAASWIDGKTAVGSMRLAFAVRSLQRLAENFTDEIVPEMENIALQCGTSQPVKDVFVEFLKDEGLDSRVIDWVENFQLTFS